MFLIVRLTAVAAAVAAAVQFPAILAGRALIVAVAQGQIMEVEGEVAVLSAQER